MSWNVSTGASMGSNVGTAIDEAVAAAGTQTEGSEEQIAAAREAALALLTAVARPEDSVQITLSGHSNPDKAPRAGWADQMVTVSVRQVVGDAQETKA